jgi:CDP-glycerol glycerophosphotransferase (TagB/SpsB family)
LILVAGDKTRQRMIDRHPIMADRIKSCGYPKFDTLDLNRKPKLFENDRPVVVYNPHFDPRLSSWYRFGQDVLRYFAEQDQYNLVFAPHVMLFRKLIHGSMEHRQLRWRGTVPAEMHRLPQILIDTGSTRSVDMTYTLAGDIYLGDVSSQIYEWIIRPRPAIFLNSHAANWAEDSNYAHWNLGPVLDNHKALPAALATASAPQDPFRTAQEAAREANFAQSDRSASQRCALELSQILV